MFINYNPKSGVSVSTSRNPSATSGELSDLVSAVISADESICCNAEGAKDALEDGAFLATLNIDDEDAIQAAVEEIHAALAE